MAPRTRKATEVDKPAPAPVPALVNTPALAFDSDDVQLPRIYIAHPASKQVEESDGVLRGGMIFSSFGGDDTDPVVLHDPKSDDVGLLVHVLDWRKGKSLSEEGELETWAFNDPAAPPEAWVTHNYLVCLPEVDPETPYKMLFTRTKTAAAKQINTIIQKNQGRGPAWNNAFRITSVQRKNDKGTFYVPRIKPVEADVEHINAATALVPQIASQATSAPALTQTTDEPSI